MKEKGRRSEGGGETKNVSPSQPQLPQETQLLAEGLRVGLEKPDRNMA